MPEPENQGSQGSFGIAAPEFFATVELSTRATDSGQLAHARVAIVDEGGEPVSGIAVYGSFTAGVHIDVQAHTNATGVAYFESLVPGGAQAGFQVELVSYEIAGELAYVRPQSIEPGELEALIDHTIKGDLVAAGVGTSTGAEETNAVEEPVVNGESTSYSLDSSASSRTSDGTITDQGVGTSTGIETEEADDPTDDGVGTSTGIETEEADNPTDDGVGTSTGVSTLN